MSLLGILELDFWQPMETENIVNLICFSKNFVFVDIMILPLLYGPVANGVIVILNIIKDITNINIYLENWIRFIFYFIQV